MKKLFLLLMVCFAAVAARAQLACNAALTWSQTPNTYTVTFNNTSTATPASTQSNTSRTIGLYTANPLFGPAIYLTTISGNTGSFTFANPGTYFALTQVYHADSSTVPVTTCYDSLHSTITVVGQACALSPISKWGIGLNRSFQVNGGVSSPGVTYTWNFGNGGPTATGNPVSCTYASPGTYTVTVTATGTGCTNTATTTHTIYPPINCANTNAAFTAGTPTSLGNVTFTNTSTPNSSTVPNGARYNNWYYGDGSTGYSYNQQGSSHTYSVAGTYTVMLASNWYDSSAAAYVCPDTAYQTVTINSIGGFNCAASSNSYTTTPGPGTTVYFNSTLSPATVPGYYSQNDWTFGDGTTLISAGSVGHTYATAGTYNTRLVTRWILQNSNTVVCRDTSLLTITVTATNMITGYVRAQDSLGGPHNYKVWLINYNPQTNMLDPVDSTTVSGSLSIYFQFNNKPAGVYRTKAHRLNQAAMSTGYVPTYRDSSITWSLANTFTHNSGTTYSGGIFLRQGLVTSGPGFVGGNVLMGANKGTADGDPVANQLVFLRNPSGVLVQSAYTNAAGQYSFTDIPVGTYSVYPEEMNYATTPSDPVTITAGSASATGVGFKRDDAGMTIKPASATGIRSVQAATFSLIPNPSTGAVVLAFGSNVKGGADVRITSLTGQVVHQAAVNTASSVSLDLARLESGLYFVVVSTEKGTYSEKLLLTK